MYKEVGVLCYRILIMKMRYRIYGYLKFGVSIYVYGYVFCFFLY